MARTRNLTPPALLRDSARARVTDQASCDRIRYAFDVLQEALTSPDEYYNARQLAALAEGLKSGIDG